MPSGDFSRPSGGRKPLRKKKTTGSPFDAAAEAVKKATEKVEPKSRPVKRPPVYKPPTRAADKDVKSQADRARGEAQRRKDAAATRTRQAQVKDTKSAEDRGRVVRYIARTYKGGLRVKGAPVPALPKDLQQKRAEKLVKARKAERQAKITAPAVKVLDQTVRPVRAIAGASDELVKGKGAGAAASAAKRGLIKNKGPTFSTVLKHAGAPKPVQTVGGFALDVVADPTTYLTVGTAVPARKLAQKEGERVLKKALDKGMTREAADRVAQRAARRVLEKQPKNKGVQIGVRAKIADRGIDVKSSGRLSATISGKTRASKVATRIRESGPVQGLGKAFVHDFKPRARTPEAHQAMRAAAREHRARTAVAAKAIDRRYGKALRKAVRSPEDQRKVIDAIESGTVHELPDALQKTARTVSKDLDVLHREAARRGLSIGRRENYVPHVHKDTLDPKARRKGGGVTRVAADQRRKIDKSIAELRDEGSPIFSEDLPRVMARKANKEAQRASLHDFWQKVAKTGRDVKPHTDLELKQGELVYKVTPTGLDPVAKTSIKGDLVSDGKAVEQILEGKRSGRYVVLNHADVEDMKGRLSGGAPSDDEVLRWYDKAQGTLKTIYTVPNPSYHLRNLYGDSYNAWLGDVSANSLRQARAILGSRIALHKAEGAAEQFTEGSAKVGKTRVTRKPKTDRKIKIRGKEYSHAQLIKEAEEAGAINQGFIGRELEDLRGKDGPISRGSQYREDLPRLATYLSARKRGMSPSEAAEWVQKHHFDYGDLTSFERKVARRVIPFYTFFARNTRLQATKVFTRPGKTATLAKLLEEASIAAGFSSYKDYAEDLKDYEQRGVPIPIKVNGKVYNHFVALPTMDLNQLTAAPGDQIQSLANRVTFFKTIGELALNYSVFFQGPIQDEDHPLVQAPEEVGALPGPVRRKLGITDQWVNPKTGKKTWAWPAKVDFAVRATPEGNFALQQMLPERGSRQQTAGDSRIAMLTGVRRTPYQTDERDLSKVREKVRELDKKLARMRDTGRAEDPKLKGHYTVEYQRLLDERKKLMDQRGKVEKKLGRPEAKRLKRRPLSEDQKLEQKLNDFLDKDPDKELEDKLDRFLSSAG